MSRALPVLKRAIHAVLSQDAALVALIGGRILDRPPGPSAMPFLLYGRAASEARGTGTEPMEEMELVLEAWTDASSQSAGLSIAARVTALLQDRALDLSADRLALVSLTHRATRTRRDAGARAVVSEMIFRAVTEG